MQPNTYRYRLLRAMAAKPCSTRTFTDASGDSNSMHLSVPARHIESAFAELLSDGLIELYEGDKYIATAEGVALVTAPTTVATVRSHTSLAQPAWTPPKWTPTRPGADDHRKFKSLTAWGQGA